MKQAVLTFGLVCAMLSMTVPKAAAQAVSIHADVMKDWTGMKATMDKIANAMPEDKFTYKPTPAQRDFGQQILHIAQVNARFLGGTPAAATVTGKAAVIKAMNDTFDAGTAQLQALNDQTILQAATGAPAFLGPSTRARIFNFLIGHTWDIYGQMAVYLRLNGITPPASVRP